MDVRDKLRGASEEAGNHCGICQRAFEHSELTFTGPAWQGEWRTVGYCCMERLKLVRAMGLFIKGCDDAVAEHIIRHHPLFRSGLGPVEVVSVPADEAAPAIDRVLFSAPFMRLYPLSPAAGQYTDAQILAFAQPVPESELPAEVKRWKQVAEGLRMQLTMLRWPDGIVALFCYAAEQHDPKPERVIASYRTTATANVQGGTC